MKRIFYMGTLEDMADLIEQNLEDQWGDEADNWDNEDLEEPSEEELEFSDLINLILEEF